MSATNIWLATASALALLAGPAVAQNTTTTEPNVTIVQPDGPAEQTGEAIDEAVQDAGEAAEDAAQAADSAVESAGEAMETAETPETTVETVETVETPATTMETPAATVDPAPTIGAMDEPEVESAEGTPVEGQMFMQSPDTFLASTLMDATVIDPAGEDIGSVSDLVMTSDGNVTGVVIGVGGWLGIGQKSVAIEMDRIEITQDENDNLAFQLEATREELENAPEFQTQEDQEAEAAASAAGAGAAGGMSTTTSQPPATAAQ